MGRDESKYRLLENRDDDETSHDSSQPPEGQWPTYFQSTRSRWLWGGLAVLLTIVCGGAGFLWGLDTGKSIAMKSVRTPYMQLEYNQPHTIWWNTEFSNASKKATDAEIDRLWDTQIPWEQGIIALRKDEAAAMGLPESAPWPWDSKNKGIYIVNAHHLLHCVRILYISIQQYRRGKEQTISYAHVLHCLDSLRVEVMCHADDTLRYVPPNGDPPDGRYPGDGQERTCRDWNRVMAFTEKHDPCYQYYRPGDDDLPNLERFKFCPPGSPYLPKIRQFFGLPDDWVPPERDGPRELDW